MSCDTLSDEFANCLLDHVITTEKSYSASNDVISQLNNGVIEKNSIIGNSKNENKSAITSDSKDILGLNKGIFEGVDIRLLSRVLADDVANSFWNIQASSGQVSGSADPVSSVTFFFVRSFPEPSYVYVFSFSPLLRIAFLLRLCPNHLQNDHYLYLSSVTFVSPFSSTFSLPHSPRFSPPSPLYSHTSPLLHLYIPLLSLSLTSTHPLLYPSPPSLSAATQQLCEHRCTAKLHAKRTHGRYREEDAVCCSAPL